MKLFNKPKQARLNWSITVGECLDKEMENYLVPEEDAEVFSGDVLVLGISHHHNLINKVRTQYIIYDRKIKASTVVFDGLLTFEEDEDEAEKFIW